MSSANNEKRIMPHELCIVSRRQTQLPHNKPQVNPWAMSYPVLVVNLQATSLMGNLPPRLQLLPNSSKIKMSLIDTAYMPETS
jgi:hypothetical protein